MTTGGVIVVLLLTLAAAAGLPVAEESLRGETVDHIILLVPDRSPARFVGPDLHLREIRYQVGAAGSAEPRVRGTVSFARDSALQKKLRALLKEGPEFEMVIYILAAGELARLRFLRVKVVRGEKNLLEWTAAGVETQPLRETPGEKR
jgi:hypothetical protein